MWIFLKIDILIIMNILPKKSWHVRNKDNIAKVRRDEENARLEEEKLAKRAALAEQEARTKFLRDRVHGHSSLSGSDLQSLQSSSIDSPPTSIVSYNESQTKHINFFQEVESGTAVTKTTNSEYEAEKKAEQEKNEKAIGVLKYLGQSTVEGQTPWYLKKESKDDTKLEKTKSIKDLDKKNRLDPLGEINSFLEETKKSDSKKEKKKKEKKQHKEKSTKGKKTIEELRAERLQREKEERFRAEKLIRELKEGKTGKNVEEEDPYRGSYYSQYNPDLAKKPKWNRYQPY